MNIKQIIKTITAGACALLLTVSAFAADGKNTVRELVLATEKAGQALVNDDLKALRLKAQALEIAARKHEQADLAEKAAKLRDADSLEAARKAFNSLSHSVIALADKHEGYYIMTCPMVEDGLWLQTSDEVANPYMGQRMVRCGGVGRKTGARDTGNPDGGTRPAQLLWRTLIQAQSRILI